MAPPCIRIPKDIFFRLQQDTQPWPRQGILFGVREECIDLGHVIYVKGFVPYRSDNLDLDATVGHWMNHRGMTLVGFYAAPSADLFDDCQNEEIAACYFESLEASIVRTVGSTIANQCINSAAPVDSSAALIPLCHGIFQSLVGLVISTHRSSPKTTQTIPPISHLLPPIAPGACSVTAYVCAPTRQDVYAIIKEEISDAKPRIKFESDDLLPLGEKTEFGDEKPPEEEDPEGFQTIAEKVTGKQRLRALPFQHNYEIIPGYASSYLYTGVDSSHLSISTQQDSLHINDNVLFSEEEIEGNRQRISRLQNQIESILSDIKTTIDKVYAPACKETDQLISILKVLDGREVGDWARVVIVAADNDMSLGQQGTMVDAVNESITIPQEYSEYGVQEKKQGHDISIDEEPHEIEIVGDCNIGSGVKDEGLSVTESMQVDTG